MTITRGPASDEQIHLLRTALAEIGHGDAEIRPPTDDEILEYRHRGDDIPTCMIDEIVPDEICWRACAMVTLRLEGPASTIRCAQRSGSAWAPCPEHLTVALLDGSDPGCQS